MTTEEKALALVNAVQAERNWPISKRMHRGVYSFDEALCRAIEAHEADNARNEQRLADQAKAFSDAARKALSQAVRAGTAAHARAVVIGEVLTPFILPEPEPDPLVEIAREMTLQDGVFRTDSLKAAIREGRAGNTASDDFYDRLRMALSARGYRIERIEQ